MLALTVVALASGCATTSIDTAAPGPRAAERLAGGGIGMLRGALAGAAGAVVLTGEDPEATLYVSVVTVPAGALFGLVTGLDNPARFNERPPSSMVASASGTGVSPEMRDFVRSVALTVGRRVRNK